MEEPYLIPMPFGSSPPIPNRSDRADLLDKINPAPIVEIIRHKLLGEELINGKWTPIPALINRRLSDVGAWELANLILSASTISASISKFKDVEIKRRAYSIAVTAQIMACENWIAYGIKYVSQFYFIHEIVFTNTLAVLKQADEASIQELLKATIMENRNIQTEKKEGFSSKVRRALGFQ